MSADTPTIRSRLRRAGWNVVYGEDFSRVQSLVWKSQWWSRAQIEQFQWDRIRELLRRASTDSKFYRGRLTHTDVTNTSPEIYRRIPRLTRADVVAAGAAIGIPTRGPRALRRHSGGSSGLSVSIPLDRATYAWYPAGLGRGLRWWGTELSERGVLLVGNGATGWRTLAAKAKDWMINWMRLPVGDDFDARAESVLTKIRDFEPDFIYGYPSALDTLARKIEVSRMSIRPPKVIALTGEPLYRFQRTRISDRWSAPVAEEYGCGEVGTIAFECPHATLHATEENAFSEMSDGALLVTHLHNTRFPLIRYDTGDMGNIALSECACSRSLRALVVTGRSRDRLTGPDGPAHARPFLNEFFAALPKSAQGRTQVIHRRAGSIVIQAQRGAGNLQEIRTIGHEILGPDWHISVVEAPFLLRLPSGKLPYFLRHG